MATYNITIATSGWTLIASTSDTDFLVTWDVPKLVEFASTELNEVPTVKGHRISRETQVSREIIGAGYVWAKLVNDSSISNLVLTVSSTTTSSGAVGGYDSTEQVQKVAVLTWNALTLAWERSTGSTSGGESSSPVTLTKRFDISTNTVYTGSASVGTAESSTGWVIKKVEFINSVAVSAKVASGAWSNRTQLSYL